MVFPVPTKGASHAHAPNGGYFHTCLCILQPHVCGDCGTGVPKAVVKYDRRVPDTIPGCVWMACFIARKHHMISLEDTRHHTCRVQIRGAGHVESDVIAKVLKRMLRCSTPYPDLRGQCPRDTPFTTRRTGPTSRSSISSSRYVASGIYAGADRHKTPEDDDVEVSITHCGICGSDLHTVSGGWYV